ncbi:MAG: Crp/Fnr family transcriptional regulator [Planctomycetales bacterium]
MSTAEIEDELRKLHLSSVWSDSIASRLAALSRFEKYPEHHILFREGDVARDAYLVCHGQVALDMSAPGRKTARILTVGRGELLAWSPLVGEPRLSATATTLTPTQLIVFSGPDLLKLCAAEPAIGYPVMQRLSWAMARRLTATRLQLMDLYAHTTPQLLITAGEQP